jgi:RNA polymerase sigma factor (TIGR02999 family)
MASQSSIFALLRIAMDTTRQPLTSLLDAAGNGDHAARDQLFSLALAELRRLASSTLAGDGARRHLQTTELISEAYLRLFGNGNVDWKGRGHFFSAAANAMRRICVDDARKRNRVKRGGGEIPVPILDDVLAAQGDPFMLLALDEALAKLESIDPRRAEVVTLRYYGGLTVDETAAALGISARTVDVEWRFARAWLRRELRKGDSTSSRGPEPHDP